MQFLKTAFWVILAVAIALFCKANNRPVDIKIWGDIVWETRIWFPVVLGFLLGALPIWIIGRARIWRLRRRLDSAERALANMAATNAPPPSLIGALPDAAPLSSPFPADLPPASAGKA